MACDERVWDEAILRAVEPVAQIRPVDVLRGTTVAAMAERVLRDAPERFAVCGFSQGGIVALEIAAQAPGRIIGVGAIGCSARAPTAEQESTWAALGEHARRGDVDAVVDALLPALLPRSAGERVGALVRSMAHSVGATVLRDQLAAQRSRPDRRGDLAAIRCPALAIAARDDAACPVERVAEVADAIPRARLAVVEQAGHLCTLTQSRAVAGHLVGWADEALAG
jgi:pimeloyl-ACP methyl ester carboxylesterase